MAKGGRSPVSGGWIKFEKKLREDIRVKRMARIVPELLPGLCNGDALHAVTLCVTVILGALAQLWMHADTFAREDDTLDLTAEEIDGLVGIDGFSTILPSDWCALIDKGGVKLPNYQKHNGPKAKEQALGALRVAKHRANHGNGIPLQQESKCNGDALPDQTRLDQTRRTEERARVPRETNTTDVTRAGAVCIAMKAEGMIDVSSAHPLLLELLKAGAEIGEFVDAARRAVADGKRFAYALAIVRGQREDAARRAAEAQSPRGKGPTAEEVEREALRALMDRRAALRPSLADFRDPNPGETAEQYRKAQDAEWMARQPRDVHGVAARLAAAKAIA